VISTEKLKQLRVNNGWSQEQLAEISGLGVRTIQRIEKEGKCSLESKMAIASAFQITPHELDQVNDVVIGEGGINWSGIVGLVTTVTLIMLLLSLSAGLSNFIDLYSIVLVIGLPFGLSTSTSGFMVTLRVYQGLKWFVFNPTREKDLKVLPSAFRKIIIYNYAAGLLGFMIGLISIFTYLSINDESFWKAIDIRI
jgi:DNA-binding XRE family transcriptional regulator